MRSNIFKYLANLPLVHSDTEGASFLTCELQPSGLWSMHYNHNGIKIKIEIGHNAFVAWIQSKGIEHDINCTGYDLEI